MSFKEFIFTALVCACVAPVSRAASAIYVGTGMGLFKSTDNGTTFELLTEKIGTNPHPLLRGVPQIWNIAVGSADARLVYMAGTYGSTSAWFKSRDGGDTWSVTPLTVIGAIGAEITVDPGNSNVVYVTNRADGTAQLSMDGGVTWTPVTLPPAAGGRIFSLTVDPNAGRVLYARPYGTVVNDELTFKSLDYGNTWAVLSQVPGPREGKVFVDPRNPRHLILTAVALCENLSDGCGPFRSLDGGVTWTNQNLRGPVTYTQAVSEWVLGDIGFDPKTNKIYLTTHQSGLGPVIMSTTDGQQWTAVSNDPLLEAGFYKPARLFTDSADGLGLYSFSNQFNPSFTLSNRVLKSADGGYSWTSHPGFNAQSCAGLGCSARIYSMALPPPPTAAIQNVSTASYVGGTLASASIVSIFGDNLAQSTVVGDGSATSLAGTSVTVTDSTGVSRRAPLFLVSPTQINYLMPADLAPGQAIVRVTRLAGGALEQKTWIVSTAPGILPLNSSWLAAATVLRVSGGKQTNENVFAVDGSGNVVAKPISLGPASDQVYLTVYGTGFRAAGTNGVKFSIGGLDVPVSFAGAQGEYAGLDQVNVLVPRSLAGKGTVPLVLTASGQPSNTTYLRFE